MKAFSKDAKLDYEDKVVFIILFLVVFLVGFASCWLSMLITFKMQHGS